MDFGQKWDNLLTRMREQLPTEQNSALVRLFFYLRSSLLNKKTNLDELSSSFLFSKDDLRSKKDELRPNFVQWV